MLGTFGRKGSLGSLDDDPYFMHRNLLVFDWVVELALLILSLYLKPIDLLDLRNDKVGHLQKAFAYNIFALGRDHYMALGEPRLPNLLVEVLPLLLNLIIDILECFYLIAPVKELVVRVGLLLKLWLQRPFFLLSL